MSAEVIVKKLPQCAFCERKARYDFATRMGPWAFACTEHYVEHRAWVTLGTGKGQHLVLETDIKRND